MMATSHGSVSGSRTASAAITSTRPCAPAASTKRCASMLEYEGRPFALDLVVDTDTPMVGMWHTLSSGFYRSPVGLLAVPRMFRGEVSTVPCP